MYFPQARLRKKSVIAEEEQLQDEGYIDYDPDAGGWYSNHIWPCHQVHSCLCGLHRKLNNNSFFM